MIDHVYRSVSTVSWKVKTSHNDRRAEKVSFGPRRAQKVASRLQIAQAIQFKTISPHHFEKGLLILRLAINYPCHTWQT